MMESCRIVVVSGVPDVLPDSRMIDKLTIHFQSYRRSRGGDVEEVTYPTDMEGVAFVTFDTAKDAERVVRQEQQIMMDSELPDEYLLTVFPFTRDVFLYVSSATVDLSVFGRDESSLIQTLRSAHRSLRFQPSLQNMKATVEGPFVAVQALRQDLILRAGRLKSNVSAQTVKLRETPLNPRVISHRECVGCVSCSGSKAKPGPASSNCLSTLPQTTGKAAEVSNAKTENASSRRKVVGSLGDTCSDEEEEQRDRPRLEMPTEGAEAEPRQELNAGVRSSLSGLDLLSDEEISAGADAISKKSIRPARISTQEEDQEEDQEDTCVWVDSYIFRYIEKFNKWEFDRHLKDLNASIERTGSDLTRILLTDRETSKSALRIQYALEDLKSLVEFWQSILRVQQIDYDNEEPETLIQICSDVNLLYSNVLYIVEDSCVKVIGSSVSSHLFCKLVEERLAKLRH
ncbi:uncharacterized protein LOC119483536 [Sebastes umbrosus]|uniref:uncharacterized protein LOC119483536 n=1 Tax=Sebastes umbrosus TaxID=72105 RepID=UPI0018A00A39|nr:uncharacterized protein LOC119483536 [Sebastes umbrosus]